MHYDAENDMAATLAAIETSRASAGVKSGKIPGRHQAFAHRPEACK